MFSNQGRSLAPRSLATVAAGLVICTGLATPASGAQGVVTQEEALADAFPPPATVVRRTAYLDEIQVDRARSLAGSGVDVDRSVVSYYVGTTDSGESSVAYFDAHRVRTLSEAVMVVVGSGGDIRSIQVLKFAEPPEYRAPDGWLDRFTGHRLDEDLQLKHGIDGIAGATMTSRAVTGGARRVLALHEVIAPLGDAP